MALHFQATFESGSLTGADGVTSFYDATMVTVVNAPDFSGDYYVSVASNNTDTPTLEQDFDSPYLSDAWSAIHFRLEKYPSSQRILWRLYDNSLNTIGSVRLSSTGQLQLYSGTTFIGSSAGLALGVRYRIELRRKAATSGDGIISLWLAEGEAASTLVTEITTSTNTNALRRLRLEGAFNDTHVFHIDNWFTDDAALPTLPALNPETTTINAISTLEILSTTNVKQDVAATSMLELASVYVTTIFVSAVSILEMYSEGQAEQTVTQLGATTLLEMYTASYAGGENLLRAISILELTSQDVYVGPESGLQVGPLVSSDMSKLINQLREGDRVSALFSLAGVDGQSGIIRVVSRSVDDQSRVQSIVPAFQQLPDPTLAFKQRGGKQPPTQRSKQERYFKALKGRQRNG